MREDLKRLRQHLGIKQVAVAREARMDQGRLSKIENDWVTPRTSEIARIKAAIAKLADEGKWQ